MRLKNLIILLILSTFSTIIFAQNYTNPKGYWSVITNSGETFEGVILSYNDEELVIQKSKKRTYSIKQSDVLKIIDRSKLLSKKGKYRPQLSETRGFSTIPNGYDLEKGQWMYNNYYLLGNQFGYGVSKHLSLRAGFTAPIVVNSDGDAGFVFSLIANATYPLTENLRANVSLGYFDLAGSNNDGYFTPSLGYFDLAGPNNDGYFTPSLGLTYGNKYNNIRLGWQTGVEESSSSSMLLSGSVRVGQKLMLMSESVYTFQKTFSDDLIVSTLILRKVYKNVSFDYGLLAFSDTFIFTAVPYFSFSWNMNPKRKNRIKSPK